MDQMNNYDYYDFTIRFAKGFLFAALVSTSNFQKGEAKQTSNNSLSAHCCLNNEAAGIKLDHVVNNRLI